jgi:DnaJ-domain-containing protein 1
VDGFIDKLADLLRNLLGDGESSSRRRTSESGGADAARAHVDPDLREAWDELDDYMKGGTGNRTRRTEGRQSRRQGPQPDESLRQDYANLEVPFGSDIETVRSSYKSLMLKYHPDKYASNPERQRVALEITKKINESFERIRARQGSL